MAIMPHVFMREWGLNVKKGNDLNGWGRVYSIGLLTADASHGKLFVVVFVVIVGFGLLNYNVGYYYSIEFDGVDDEEKGKVGWGPAWLCRYGYWRVGRDVRKWAGVILFCFCGIVSRGQ